MEVLYDLRRFQEGINRLRQLSRWLLGRESEMFWDNYDDDREWDIGDDPRRNGVPQSLSASFNIGTYGAGLSMELRIRLGLFRLRLGDEHIAEAKVSRES